MKYSNQKAKSTLIEFSINIIARASLTARSFISNLDKTLHS